MTTAQVIEMARAKGVVDDETLSLIANDPGIVAWLDEWLPNRAAGTLAMVQGVIPPEISARLPEMQAAQFKSALPVLIWLYTKGDNAPTSP